MLSLKYKSRNLRGAVKAAKDFKRKRRNQRDISIGKLIFF